MEQKRGNVEYEQVTKRRRKYVCVHCRFSKVRACGGKSKTHNWFGPMTHTGLWLWFILSPTMKLIPTKIARGARNKVSTMKNIKDFLTKLTFILPLFVCLF